MEWRSPKVIAVEPGSAFGDILDIADDVPVVELVRDDRRYRLESISETLPPLPSRSPARPGRKSFSGPKEDLLKDYDPERFREALFQRSPFNPKPGLSDF